ncbi:MAG: hypothetical protein HC840_01135 [Leptolyngbyaceae cyanobacterium RM2_2_4]|nr:hypothetical protein [Leptolyngbyaceae cyanobacterium RM2_2_4]
MSDGSESRNNVLRIEAATGVLLRRAQISSTSGILLGKKYYLVFDYYIPAGQAEINQFVVTTHASNSSTTETGSLTTVGAWTTYVGEITALNSLPISLTIGDGGTTISTVLSTGQYVYVDRIRLMSHGCTTLVDLTVAGATKTDRISYAAASTDAVRGSTTTDTIE